MNYITIEELINEHEVLLSSYYESGSADSGILYPRISRCLNELGAKILPIKEGLLQVKNHTGDLPEDYSSLISLVTCHTIKLDKPVVTGQISYEKAFCHIEPCMTENSYNHDEFGRYKNIYIHEREKIVLSQIKELTIGSDIQGCCNPFNKNAYEVEIKNNQVVTNFDNGLLHIVYRSSITEGQILVPNYPEIITWLLAEMEVLTLRTILMNTTQDVSQRFQLAKAELHISKENARAFWKRNGVKDFINLKSYWSNRFRQFSRIIK